MYTSDHMYNYCNYMQLCIRYLRAMVSLWGDVGYHPSDWLVMFNVETTGKLEVSLVIGAFQCLFSMVIFNAYFQCLFSMIIFNGYFQCYNCYWYHNGLRNRQEVEVLDHARDLVAALLDAIRQLAQRSFHWSTAPFKIDKSDWNLPILLTF